MTKPTKLAAVSGDLNAAVLSERLRVSAILESAEGKRNPAMAQELALRSPLDVETARSGQDMRSLLSRFRTPSRPGRSAIS